MPREAAWAFEHQESIANKQATAVGLRRAAVVYLDNKCLHSHCAPRPTSEDKIRSGMSRWIDRGHEEGCTPHRETPHQPHSASGNEIQSCHRAQERKAGTGG